MSVLALVNELQSRGVRFYLRDGEVRCRAPRELLTDDLRCAMREHKAVIREILMQEDLDGRQPIALIRRDEPIPASYQQQGLWFIDQLRPERGLFCLPYALQLVGHLDREALRRAANEIVCRHETLRTTFAASEGRAIQVIAPELRLSIPLIDLSQLSEDERDAEVSRLAREETEQSFDLSPGPLLRIRLLHLGKRAKNVDEPEHVMLITLHHIISDGWSEGIFVQELVALYEAFSQGLPSPLPKLPIQYADYVGWQRERLQGKGLKRLLGYWREQLKGAPSVLELPTDRPRAAVSTYRGAVYHFAVPKALGDQLHALSHREGVTLFMTLLAAFQVLLSRYSGQDDICVGAPIANRNEMELEGLIGLFVNTLVLRTRLSGNPSFIELLDRVREMCLGAQAHQDMPFEKLVEDLAPIRSMSYGPLVQVELAFQNTPASDLRIRGLRVNPLSVDAAAAKLDLIMAFTEEKSGLAGSITYSTDLFEGGTIERLASHFVTLLEAIVARPEARLSELPLLSKAEQQRVLIGWNATEIDYGHERCIHEIFEAQVARAPEAVAVIFEDRQLSYGELDSKANQLAHHLRRLGVGPDTLVGICVECSLEMIVGILGILKAGGAYLPLDPRYPKERLAYMLADAQPKVLMTQADLRDDLPEHPMCLCLDTDWSSIARRSNKALSLASSPLTLAYVIYTSGSTGRPKGVGVAHRGLTNLCAAQARYFRVRSLDRVLQFASLSFDAASFELVMALSTGATLCIGRREQLLPGDSLKKFLLFQAVSIATVPPSALALLPEGEYPDLRALTVAGEACSVALIDRWAKGREFYNLYGPTEATIWSSVARLQSGDAAHIGTPIDNVQLYILDGFLNPVPPGVTGELYIGGVGLARGYLNRPELTAARFTPNPFSDKAGERLYRTGDLARHRPDGSIDYLGRSDHQVKVRGFRIELGEIEAVLSQHPEVREVVVVIREETPGDKRLVAYLTYRRDTPAIEELRAWVTKVLPEHMVPAQFVTLDSLPVSPNGKIDRRALPDPHTFLGASCTEVLQPRNAIEEAVAAIWRDVLRVETIGIHDDFFDLGGNSLLAVQVVLRLQDVFSIEIPVASLFDTKTVSDLAELIATLQVEQHGEALEAILGELAQLTDDDTAHLLSEKQG